MKRHFFSTLAVLFFFSLAPAGAQSVKKSASTKPAGTSDAQIGVLARSTGSGFGLYLLECYLALTDAERALGTDAAKGFRRHLEIQVPLLEFLKTTCNEIDTAFPEDKDLTVLLAKIREAATAILSQNEATTAYIDGDSKNLESIRKKHAASKALLVPLLKLQKNGDDIP